MTIIDIDPTWLKRWIKATIRSLRKTKKEPPTKAEVLDALFSKRRHDPESAYIARRLEPYLKRYLNRK